MATVTKKELVDRIADRTGTKRVVVKKIVQSFLNDVIQELGHGNRLEFRDFGVFETKERAARTAQNPKTLQRVEVPPKVVKVARGIGEAAARVALDVVGAALKNKAEELLSTWLD